MEGLDIFLNSEQPTTCPQCGNRTEIVNDYKKSQEHSCLSEKCNFKFVLEFENEAEL